MLFVSLYLFERQKDIENETGVGSMKRERERGTEFLPVASPPQYSQEPGHGQRQRPPFLWVAGMQVFKLSPACSQGVHQQEAGMKSRDSNPDTLIREDAGISHAKHLDHCKSQNPKTTSSPKY